MSYADFCRCTPEEFGAVCRYYHSEREAQYRNEWERVRWQTSILLQPYIKGKKSPRDLLPLPWDTSSQAAHGPEKEGRGKGSLPKDVQMKRMAEVASRVSTLRKDSMADDGCTCHEECYCSDNVCDEEAFGTRKKHGSQESQGHDDNIPSCERYEVP